MYFLAFFAPLRESFFPHLPRRRECEENEIRVDIPLSFFVDTIFFVTFLINVMTERPGPLKLFEFSRKESLAVFFLVTTLLIGTGIKYAIDQHWWLPDTEVVDTNSESVKLKIDLNRAEWYELIILPGIGEKKARAIVEYRKRAGGFKTIEQLSGVNGIGGKTVKKLEDLVFINEQRIISPQSRSPDKRRRGQEERKGNLN